MGTMVNGEWRPGEVTEDSKKGGYERHDSGFREWVTPDGGPGPDGQPGRPAQDGRYHLYVSYACPWAHRALVVRALKGLEDAVGVSVVDPVMREDGWTFRADRGGTGDPVNGAEFLYQLYARARDGYTGKVTVPVLWDKEQGDIVSNESADVIRMLNSWGTRGPDLYPEAARERIDSVNERVYATVNNGVYRAGFATKRDAYEEAFGKLFASLDWLEGELEGAEWLAGDRLTEADVRLWTTLVRFDAVYHGHFKCNLRRIADYPNLSALLERVLALPGVADTVHLDHIKTHYYASHRDLNPTGIVPVGPALAWAGRTGGGDQGLA